MVWWVLYVSDMCDLGVLLLRRASSTVFERERLPPPWIVGMHQLSCVYGVDGQRESNGWLLVFGHAVCVPLFVVFLYSNHLRLWCSDDTEHVRKRAAVSVTATVAQEHGVI